MSDQPVEKKIKLEKGVEFGAPRPAPPAPVTLKRYPCDLIRGGVIALGRKVGILMMHVPRCLPVDDGVALEQKEGGKEIISALKDMFKVLSAIAGVLGTDLQSLALNKMDINARKYPVSETLVRFLLSC